MSRFKVALESSIPYLSGLIEPYADVVYLPNQEMRPERIKDADAIIVRSITRCGADLLDGTAVRHIATATAGVDHIDAEYCAHQGIAWYNAPGCNAIAVAQWVASCLSVLSIQDGEALRGKTIGIVGVGHVGRQVQHIAWALGMKTLLYDPPRADKEGNSAFVMLEELLERSDVITLHVPLEYSGRYPTYHMVDEAFLEKCRRGVVLLNACRGAVADTAALIRGRTSGRIRRLCIDCWEGEPNIAEELLACTDIATPHIAGFSADGKLRGARMALAAILGAFGCAVPADLFSTDELPNPDEPRIDLDALPRAYRVEHAQLRTFDPRRIDAALRGDIQGFERLRRHYQYPREMSAYTIVGGSAHERDACRALGFTLEEH